VDDKTAGICFSPAAMAIVTALCTFLTGAIAALWRRDTGRSDDRVKKLEVDNAELNKENVELTKKIDRLYGVLLQAKGTSASALELARVEMQPQ
jgi:hypothetical protein